MGFRSRLLIDQATFTADTGLENIPADNVKYLQFGAGALQAGTVAPTLAQVQAIWDEILVTFGGHQICKITVDDLVAYNILWLDNTPHFRLGGGDNYLAYVAGIRLPVYATKNGRSLMTQITYGAAITNADTQTLSVEYQYQNTPFPLHFAYQYQSLAGAVNARWTGLARAGAALQGLLVYQPWTSVDDAPALPSIAKLSIVIDDREVFANNLFTSKVHHANALSNLIDGAATGWAGLLCEATNGAPWYTYIDLSQEPWSADDIEIITSNACGAYNSGSTNTCRIVGVYSER